MIACAPCTSILEVGTGTGALIPLFEAVRPWRTSRLGRPRRGDAATRSPSRGRCFAVAGRRSRPSLRRGAGRGHRVRCSRVPQLLPALRRQTKRSGSALECHPSRRAHPDHPRLKPRKDQPRSTATPVRPSVNDLLPVGAETRRMLIAAGFTGVWVEDTTHRYLAAGRRG